jgi:hypothetical protein
MPRRRFEPTQSFEERLINEARRLHEEAEGMPPGLERDQLIRKARQAETASHMSDWLASTELQPPK